MLAVQVVIDEIHNDAATALQGVKLFAQLLSSDTQKDAVLEQLQGWLADPVSNSNPYLLAMAGCIYLHVGDLAEALKAVHSTSSLELFAIQVYRHANRRLAVECSLTLLLVRFLDPMPPQVR